MVHLNMRRKGLQSTREKPIDINLEYKRKINLLFCTTMEPSTTTEGGVYSDICVRFPIA